MTFAIPCAKGSREQVDMTLHFKFRSGEDQSSMPRTRTDELRMLLADEIIAGTLSPGTPLEELSIARRFEVSRTPVREAIRELAASGLVEIRAHRAAIVAQPAPRELIGMFETMAELEASCAAFAAGRMTSGERAALDDVHEQLRLMVRSGNVIRYRELNQVFHNTIYAGAHNKYLADLAISTRTRLSPFRGAQFRKLGRLAKSHQEHDHVVTAIQRGDGVTAAAAMRAHLMTVCHEYEAYLRSQRLG
jgi:DNA-binding GntR family transcriptional regulator